VHFKAVRKPLVTIISNNFSGRLLTLFGLDFVSPLQGTNQSLSPFLVVKNLRDGDLQRGPVAEPRWWVWGKAVARIFVSGVDLPYPLPFPIKVEPLKSS